MRNNNPENWRLRYKGLDWRESYITQFRDKFQNGNIAVTKLLESIIFRHDPQVDIKWFTEEEITTFIDTNNKIKNRGTAPNSTLLSILVDLLDIRERLSGIKKEN